MTTTANGNEATPISVGMQERLAAIREKRAKFPPIETPSAEESLRRRRGNFQYAGTQALSKARLPKRQSQCEPERSGPWYEALTALHPKLGIGSIIGLIGPRGGGKTRMGVALIRAAVQKLVDAAFEDQRRDDPPRMEGDAMYMTAIDLFLRIRATYDREAGEENESQAIAAICTPSILVIDEVQERGNTAWEDRLLTHIVDKRYAAMKDTVLIGNLTPEALAESLGESIVSRLRECGEIVVCDWPSFRAGKRADAAQTPQNRT